MEVVGEAAGESTGSKRKGAPYSSDRFGVRSGTVDGAVDHVGGAAVHTCSKGGGFAFLISLCVFSSEHVGDHGIDFLKPCAVESLPLGQPYDESSHGVRGGFVDAKGCTRI